MDTLLTLDNNNNAVRQLIANKNKSILILALARTLSTKCFYFYYYFYYVSVHYASSVNDVT